LRKEGDDDDAFDVGQEQELWVIVQRLLDAQLRLLDVGEKGRVEVLSSASDHQLMDSATAAKKRKAEAKRKKKARNKWNKAAANQKAGSRLVSSLGGGIISLIMMAAFGSITSLISLSLIHQSDGSLEGQVPPTLPPSTYLGQRDLQSNVSIIMSPSRVTLLPPPTLSQIEWNALRDFFKSTRGQAWTNRSKWLNNSISYCDWKGVTCKDNHVTQLDLTNNGLSGTLSKSIGNLTYIEKLDLSDNDIKVICTIIHACLSSLAFISLHPTLTKQQCPS
jgi:Leucine-rich repeat (LRR) protein